MPLDPATGALVAGDIRTETRRVMENLGALLTAAGLGFSAVVRTTVFLADMNDFAAMNEVYGAYFHEPYPARATVQVARLPRDARVEIDVIATYSKAGTSGLIRRSQPPADPSGLPAALRRPITPSTPRSDLITFSRCFRSLISTVMSMRRALVFVGARFHVLDVRVDVGDLRADGGQQPLPILHLHRQLDRVARAGSRCRLSHSTSMRRSGSYSRLTTLGQVAECTDTPLPRVM